MNKKVISILSSIMLATGTIGIANIVKPAQEVQAASHSANSRYWNKTRKVRVTKKITFRRFDAYSMGRRYVKGRKTFKPGKVIKIRSAGEFPGWVLVGTSAGSRYWWISERANTSWMKEYHKTKKRKAKKHHKVKKHKAKRIDVDYDEPMYDTGFKGNTYTSDDGSKLTLNQLKLHKYIYEVTHDGGIHYIPKKTSYLLVVQGSFTNNSGKTIDSIEDWICNNLKVTSNGTSDNEDIEGGLYSDNDSLMNIGIKPDYYDTLFFNGHWDIKNDTTKKFAIGYILDTKITPTYLKFTPQDDEDTTSYKMSPTLGDTLKCR